MPALEELVVSGADLDRDLVAEVLKPFVRLDGDAHEMLPLPSWDGLKNDHKILVLLVAQKALVALGWRDEDSISPKALTARTGLPGGSVRPGLKRLISQRLAAQAEGGDYYVPNWAINRVKAALTLNALEANDD